MNDEIKGILDMLKDSDYIPSDDNRTYKLLDKDDTRHLLDYITNLQQEKDTYYSIVSQKLTKEIDYQRLNELQQENERLKDELNDITQVSYKDYNVWLTERHYLDTLDGFANDIKYKIAPNLTDTYRDGIKSALKHTIKYVKDNYKQETLEDYKSRCEKASDKLSFIDEALENDTLNVPLCIAKINSALNILQNGDVKNGN